jgi:hypothetical protein
VRGFWPACCTRVPRDWYLRVLCCRRGPRRCCATNLSVDEGNNYCRCACLLGCPSCSALRFRRSTARAASGVGGGRIWIGVASCCVGWQAGPIWSAGLRPITRLSPCTTLLPQSLVVSARVVTSNDDGPHGEERTAPGVWGRQSVV